MYLLCCACSYWFVLGVFLVCVRFLFQIGWPKRSPNDLHFAFVTYICLVERGPLNESWVGYRGLGWLEAETKEAAAQSHCFVVCWRCEPYPMHVMLFLRRLSMHVHVLQFMQLPYHWSSTPIGWDAIEYNHHVCVAQHVYEVLCTHLTCSIRVSSMCSSFQNGSMVQICSNLVELFKWHNMLCCLRLYKIKSVRILDGRWRHRWSAPF